MKTTLSKDGRSMAKSNPRKAELLHRREAPLATRSDLTPEATKDISGAMNAILADVFALYRENEKFSLAYERASLPRLPSASR